MVEDMHDAIMSEVTRILALTLALTLTLNPNLNPNSKADDNGEVSFDGLKATMEGLMDPRAAGKVSSLVSCLLFLYVLCCLVLSCLVVIFSSLVFVLSCLALSWCVPCLTPPQPPFSAVRAFAALHDFSVGKVVRHV